MMGKKILVFTHDCFLYPGAPYFQSGLKYRCHQCYVTNVTVTSPLACYHSFMYPDYRIHEDVIGSDSKQREQPMPDLSAEEANLLHKQCCQAIAGPRRILIVYTLHEGERNVSELAKHLNLPQSTVSRHLKELLSRGMVSGRREGSAVIYSLTDERIIEALDIMRQVLADNLRRQAQLVEIIS